RAERSRLAGRNATWPARPARTPAALALLLALCLLSATHAWHPRHPRNAATHHLAHHLLALEEPDYQRVHLAHSHAGPVRDAQSARSVQNLGIPALFDGHRVDDRGRPVEVLVAHLAEQLPVLSRPWQHAKQVADRAELAHHRKLVDEVLEREALG